MRWVITIVALVAAIVAALVMWPPPRVATIAPSARDVVELVVGSGRLRTPRQSDIGSEVAGVASQVLVDVGTEVAAGQTLLTLRDEDAQRELDRARLVAATARAELTRAKAGPLPQELKRAVAELDVVRAAQRRDDAAYRRLERLVESGSVTNAQIEDARASLEQSSARVSAAANGLQVLENQPRPEDVALSQARVAEAEAAVRIAEERLAKRTIASPFAGIVVRLAVQPGEGVAPGRTLVTVADIGNAEVFIETDENNLARLRIGQTATVIAPAFRDRPFAATLRQIDPVVDAQRGVVGLRLTPEKIPDYALVDMTVDVNIVVGRFGNALSLPASAVTGRGDTANVLVVRDGVVHAAPVTVTGDGGEYVAVEGVGAGDVVIRDATTSRPGANVRSAPER